MLERWKSRGSSPPESSGVRKRRRFSCNIEKFADSEAEERAEDSHDGE